jgi:response regulator RpfG family c-di-GMP phosphodiesterase
MERTPIILVTDDDLWQQKLIEVTLSGMGYRIILAADGEQALSFLKQGRGVHFDPDVLDVFFMCLDRILEILQQKHPA